MNQSHSTLVQFWMDSVNKGMDGDLEVCSQKSLKVPHQSTKSVGPQVGGSADEFNIVFS